MQIGQYSIPEGKKLVSVDPQTWLVVSDDRDEKQVIAHWQQKLLRIEQALKRKHLPVKTETIFLTHK
jgi:hypothetical protein